MKTQIDIKSALLGLSAGVLVMFVIGAASPPGPTGRYQIAGTAGHGLILDTVTGEAWNAFFPGDRDVGVGGRFMQPKNGGK